MDYKENNKQEVEEVISLLESYKQIKKLDTKKKCSLYNRCKSIVDHDDWYTKEQRNLIYHHANEISFFSKKQKSSLGHCSIVQPDDMW